LISGRIDERDAHSHTLLCVDNFAFGGERTLVARNIYSDYCARWQGIKDVYVASLTTYFRYAPRNMHIARGFDDFDGRDETISWHRSPVWIDFPGAALRADGIAHNLTPPALPEESHKRPHQDYPYNPEVLRKWKQEWKQSNTERTFGGDDQGNAQERRAEYLPMKFVLSGSE
jgi:hypothetical protein